MAVANGERVPAWKRLGLTLKNANDTPAASIPDQPAADSTPQKAKRSRDDHNETPRSKKIKLAETPDVSHRQLPDGQTPIPSSIKKSPTKSRDRSKSVTFAQDVKTEDGDSAQVAIKAYFAAQTEEPSAENDVEPGDKPASTSPAKEAKKEKEKKKKKKKERKEKKEKDPAPAPTQPTQKKVKTKSPKTSLVDRPTPDYVTYLSQYHTARPTWKFNKSKQNDLLKNIWNIYRVPSDLDDALVAYVSGLQGGARQRLRDAARTSITESVAFIRAEIPESKADSMDTPEARRAAFEAAEKRLEEVEGDNKDEQRVQLLRQKRKEDERAARLLAALNDDNGAEEAKAQEAAKAEQAKLETARSRKKKRKSRTDVSDSESSSSDDDSDSDSDDEEEPSKKKNKTKGSTKLASKKVKAGKESDSDSSSSSEDASSDSDSDADSDSDSDSDSSSSSDSDGESEDSGSSDSSSEEESESDSE